MERRELNCQLTSIPHLCFRVSELEKWWQFKNRVKRVLKRRWNYLLRMAQRKEKDEFLGKEKWQRSARNNSLNAGDLVRIKSLEEIKKTLNNWNQLKGCSFMEEMSPYCGTFQRVLNRVEKFLDERDYLLKKCKGIVMLEGIICKGTKDFGPCDRSCFFFWREEWLEKVVGPEVRESTSQVKDGTMEKG